MLCRHCDRAIRQLAALVAAAGSQLNTGKGSFADPTVDAQAARQDLASSVVGMQVGPHTMLDEGIEHSLDLIQRTAAVNTIFVYSHSYGGDLRKPLDYLAKDHGQPVLDQRTRNLPNMWVRQHDQYFKDTTLRHPAVDATFTYHDRDLFAEMIKPLRQRGMKVYPRILEAGGRGIVNFSKVATITAYGRPTGTGCWNHPEYIGFWRATVEDIFRSYDVDGFQWGAERASPLANIIQNGNDTSATCFCQFCRARGKAAGIDPDRAREGMEQVLKYVQALRANQAGAKPADGVAAGFLRLLLRYPEVLAWDYQYRLSREAIMKTMYDQIKRIKPAAPVGWHVDHWATSMDIIARAGMSYAEMAPWSDYLKVVMYHAVTGPRVRTWVSNVQRSVLSELTVEEALALHYDLFGYDKTLRPKPNEPPSPNTWPDYVFRETKRSVASAEGKTKIYPGIGFNVPGATDDPDTIYRVVLKAYEAGANGVVASREYEEMTVPNLESASMARVVANYAKVVTRDVHDRSTSVACWNHPEYIGFWADTMEDLFRSYDLDGIQWGAERQGPLMNVISPWDNNPPTCFCEHCRRRGAAAGIDPDRARLGFETLHTYVQGHIAKQPRPADGMFVGFLRILLRFPEILGWETQYRLGREAICDAIYRAVKRVKPAADVGWHVDHQPSSWDLVYRAEMSYEEMAPHADFIKFIGYHNVLSPRIRDWYLARFQRTILGELSLGTSLDLYYELFGYDKRTEPALAELGRKGFSPEYIYRETRHSVASANGKMKIYTGIGFDVPGSPPDDPETIYQATIKAFDAKADGIVVSREYEEMKVANLRAVGRAYREVMKSRAG